MYGPKLRKQLRRENNKNGRTTSQNSRVLDDSEACTLLIGKTKKLKKPFENSKKKLEVHMDAAMPCKKNTKKRDLLTANCSEA